MVHKKLLMITDEKKGKRAKCNDQQNDISKINKTLLKPNILSEQRETCEIPIKPKKWNKKLCGKLSRL